MYVTMQLSRMMMCPQAQRQPSESRLRGPAIRRDDVARFVRHSSFAVEERLFQFQHQATKRRRIDSNKQSNEEDAPQPVLMFPTLIVLFNFQHFCESATKQPFHLHHCLLSYLYPSSPFISLVQVYWFHPFLSVVDEVAPLAAFFSNLLVSAFSSIAQVAP